jgi:hypothetical protein
LTDPSLVGSWYQQIVKSKNKVDVFLDQISELEQVVENILTFDLSKYKIKIKAKRPNCTLEWKKHLDNIIYVFKLLGLKNPLVILILTESSILVSILLITFLKCYLVTKKHQKLKKNSEKKYHFPRRFQKRELENMELL